MSCLFFQHRSRIEDPLLVAAVVERRDQEEGPGGRGQAGHTGGERAFQQFSQGQRCIRGQVETGCDRPGQLDQRQGVTERLSEDPPAKARRETWSAGVKHGSRRSLVQRFELDLRQARLLDPGSRPVPDGEQHDDRLELQPPGDEHQHVAGGHIQQLSVVDDQQERCGRRHLRQQVE